MNINLNYNDRVPIYLQIIKEVERLVSLKILKADEQIPSIRELACNLGINPNTVKKAYDILEEKGIIIVKSTKGTFISSETNKALDVKKEELILEIKKLLKEAEAYGFTKKEIIEKL